MKGLPGKKLNVWIMGSPTVGGHCKERADRAAIVCLVLQHYFHLLFLLGLVDIFSYLHSKLPLPLSLSLSFSIKWHIHSHPLFFSTLVFTSANELWDKCKRFIWLHWTWRFTFLSKARRFNSIISLSNMLLLLSALPVEMRIFLLLLFYIAVA